MSKIFTVHVAKLGNFSCPEVGINNDLKSWFGRIAKYDRENKKRWKFTEVKVKWWYSTKSDVITIGNSDVLVYVMKDDSDSLVKKVREAAGKTVPAADRAGLTLTNESSINHKVISETYAGCRGARYVAETIFHEAMHNKTGWGNKKLHARGGIAGGDHTSVTEATIVSGREDDYARAAKSGTSHNEMMCQGILNETAGNDPVMKKNIQDMANCLGNTRSQWTDGFKFLKKLEESKKIKLDLTGDPLEGL